MTSELRPRRSTAITVLDTLLAGVRGLRHARAAGAGAAITAIGTLALVVFVLRAPYALAPLDVGPAVPPQAIVAAGTEPATTRPTGSATPSPTPTATPTPTPTATPTTTAPPTKTSAPPPPPAALGGEYTMEDSGLWGYRSSVTMRNAGGTAASGWTLVISLPRESLTVTDVSGATARRNGGTWTFTPTGATRTVPRGGSVRVRFEVNGAPLLSAPTACTVDGTACTGLTEN